MEDYILEKWLDYCLQFPHTHLSLHDDGLRVDTKLAQQAAASTGDGEPIASSVPEALGGFLAGSQECIRDQTGYVVEIRFKHAGC